MTQQILEILTWQSKKDTSDDAMISAMRSFRADVGVLPGFLQQTLYKNSANLWVGVYYWQTEKNAHDSNAAVANKATFKHVMSLIKPDSLTMEVMAPLE